MDEQPLLNQSEEDAVAAGVGSAVAIVVIHLALCLGTPGSGLSVIAAPLLLIFLVVQAAVAFFVGKEAKLSGLAAWQIILTVLGIALLFDFTCIGLPVGTLIYLGNSH